MRSLAIGMLLFAAGPLFAQSYNGHGYAVYGVGRSGGTTMFSYGGGGEGFLWKGLSAGAELAYFHPQEEFGDGAGLLSVNGGWHFTDRTRSQKLVPFVTAGYTLGFRSGTANFYNYGGGATYWFTDRVGLRMEVRDHRDREYRFLTTFRVGLSFR